MVLNGCFAGFPAFGSRSSGSPAIGFVWRVPCLFFGLHWLRRAAGCFFSLRLQMKPGERLPVGLGITMQRYDIFSGYASFPATFFSSNFKLKPILPATGCLMGVLDGRMTVLGRFFGQLLQLLQLLQLF